MEAGFTVFHEPTQSVNNAIVIIDFDACKDSERVQAYQSRGVKIVALANVAGSREIGLNEIAPLSGVLAYDLSASAFVRSLLLIFSGERVFPRDLALGRTAQA
jgi:hypothetical protein